MTAHFPDTRPFRHKAHCVVVMPESPGDRAGKGAWRDLVALLKRESPELEAEMGASVAWEASPAQPTGPRLLIGPASHNPALRTWQAASAFEIPDKPYVAVDAPRQVVVVDALSHDSISDAIQLLRTAIWSGATMLTASHAQTTTAHLDRVDAEVRRTFPNLLARVPDWAEYVQRARGRMQHPDDLATVQALMANLDDAHSWAKDPRINGRLPYDTVLQGKTCRFWRVPEWSEACRRGVRPGDQLIQPDATAWRSRTGATPHAHPWTVGYRMLSGRVGEMVQLAARRADDNVVTWSEAVPPTSWREPIEWRQLDRDTGYLRIHTWLNGATWQETFLAALADLDSCKRLIVDLRGNVGGALVAAQDARSRFLDRRSTLGSIRFSTVTGETGSPTELIAEPPSSGPRWTRPVRFLVDPLCYSATEDFLLGLQGLPHVELVGQRTGGGSGRPRTIALRPTMNLTISTALTFDRQGRSVEGKGLKPDIPIAANPNDPDAGLRCALQW